MSTDPIRTLAPLVAAAALGERSRVRELTGVALDSKVPAPVLREALLMVCLFAGFPRCLDALGGVVSVADERGEPLESSPEPDLPADESARRRLFRQRGRGLFERVYGDDTDRVLAGLFALDPELPHWVLEDAYGRVLARPALDVASRERLAVVMLCALDLPRQLRGHLLGALRCGATVEQLRGDLDVARASFPAERLRDALGQLDEASSAEARSAVAKSPTTSDAAAPQPRGESPDVRTSTASSGDR